jgi:gamma-glutamyl-gamma-aminobutyrate hydrolase PuuD
MINGSGSWERPLVALPRCSSRSRTTAISVCDERVEVRCSHREARDHLGGHLRVTAESGGGVIEAAELDATPFRLGVQWHPEEPNNTPLFEGVGADWRKGRVGLAR